VNIVILTQVYFPDTVSVAQHLHDLCRELVKRGHNVTVITSRSGYDSGERFLNFEENGNITIRRVWQTNFSKKSFLLRGINFFTFNFSLMIASISLPRKKVNCIIGTTSPPFSALVGIALSKLKKAPYYFWVMDLQPELSIASGLIRRDSISAKLFTFLGNFAIRSSNGIFSLDRFMSKYLVSRGAYKQLISEIPVWPVSEGEYVGERLNNPFRIENGFKNQTVIMFSGNHAHVHPMDTLLDACNVLKKNTNLLFAFVGGGVRKEQVTMYKEEHKLENILQFPFQPRSTFHISIAASDIQVVIMGEGQVGYTHPNKIYGAMFLGKPILYIGPEESHVSDILRNTTGNISVRHGETEKLVNELNEFSKLDASEILRIGQDNKKYAMKNFSPELLIGKMVESIESSKNL
jgi:colanic acid biosynthesis glycosyl transferase WcaI